MIPSGYVALRRGIFPHLRDGRLSQTDFIVYVTIIAQADHRTGVALTSATRVQDDAGLEARSVRRSMARLESSGYLRRFKPSTGSVLNYYVVVNRYHIRRGGRLFEVDAGGTKDPQNPALIELQHVREVSGRCPPVEHEDFQHDDFIEIGPEDAGNEEVDLPREPVENFVESVENSVENSLLVRDTTLLNLKRETELNKQPFKKGSVVDDLSLFSDYACLPVIFIGEATRKAFDDLPEDEQKMIVDQCAIKKDDGALKGTPEDYVTTAVRERWFQKRCEADREEARKTREAETKREESGRLNREKSLLSKQEAQVMWSAEERRKQLVQAAPAEVQDAIAAEALQRHLAKGGRSDTTKGLGRGQYKAAWEQVVDEWVSGRWKPTI